MQFSHFNMPSNSSITTLNNSIEITWNHYSSNKFSCIIINIPIFQNFDCINFTALPPPTTPTLLPPRKKNQDDNHNNNDHHSRHRHLHHHRRSFTPIQLLKHFILLKFSQFTPLCRCAPLLQMYICLKICPTPRCKPASICLILKTWFIHLQICLINFTNGKVTKFKMKISQLPDLPDLA